jgi:hypothetical protein
VAASGHDYHDLVAGGQHRRSQQETSDDYHGEATGYEFEPELPSPNVAN